MESRKGWVQKEKKEYLKGIKGLREDAAQQQRIEGETNPSNREEKRQRKRALKKKETNSKIKERDWA